MRGTLDAYEKLTPTGGNLILITNTLLDNRYPNKNNVIDQMKANEITLDLIRLSLVRDESLEKLVLANNGKNFLLDEKNLLLDIEDALIYLSKRDTSINNNFLFI